jgi:hypothetical protein
MDRKAAMMVNFIFAVGWIFVVRKDTGIDALGVKKKSLSDKGM